MADNAFLGLKRVLVVEDNYGVANMLLLMLDELGVDDVRLVDTISASLEALESAPFDLAIIDVQLGEENGLVVANHCSDRKMPVIISTGFSDLVLPIAYASEQILTKPYQQIDLIRTIEHFFSNSSISRAGVSR